MSCITCVTPTGDRPELFELCVKWMSTQTRKPDQWIVVDDGFTPIPEELRVNMEYIRRDPTEGEGHTLTINLRTAVPYIKGDIILIIEDDDWYGPNYIKTMEEHLKKYDLVGEKYARYYHVPAMKFKRISNMHHASLCQTGFTKKLLPVFTSCLEGSPYVDSRLWGAVTENVFLMDDHNDIAKLHCSLKGLKGRKGIGSGHDPDVRYYGVDNHIDQLIGWVGEENAKIYMKLVGQSFSSAVLIGSERVRTFHVKPTPPKPPASSPVTVITCTGDRPLSFNLLRKWMDRQTVKPAQWIVVDDGKVPLEDRKGLEYYRRDPSPKDYLHTLCLNIMVAMEHVRTEKIVIMEDDDWYSPEYVEYMGKQLDRFDLVGFGNLIFYYPSIRKYMRKDIVKQPAFSQTVFKRSIIPVIQNICARATEEYDLCGKGLIDEFLWTDPLDIYVKERKVRLTTSLKLSGGRILPPGTELPEPIPAGLIRRAERNNGVEFFNKNVSAKGKSTRIFVDVPLTLGMKGLPGRKGLTTHHNLDNKKYKEDTDLTLLKSILKSDVGFYMELFP